MIDYNNEHNSMEMTCDTCQDSGIHEGQDFVDCIDYFKSDGWQVIQNPGGTYDHLCPDCIEKEVESNKLEAKI